MALAHAEDSAHEQAIAWHASLGEDLFCLCPLTEAGFVRLTASPKIGAQSMAKAIGMLRQITALPQVEMLDIRGSWLDICGPLMPRLQGHRQTTDALLLGLAIKNNAVLVTLDRGFETLAGQQFKANLLTLA
jgi:predicted nucleic acid-binding protein